MKYDTQLTTSGAYRHAMLMYFGRGYDRYPSVHATLGAVARVEWTLYKSGKLSQGSKCIVAAFVPLVNVWAQKCICQS